MRLTWIALCLAAAAALAGCANSPGALKEDPDKRRVASVDENYQVVLKRLVEYEAGCGFRPLVPIGQVIHDVQHYPDMRQATIVRGYAGVVTEIREIVEMHETGVGKTELVVYAEFHPELLAQRTVEIATGRKVCSRNFFFVDAAAAGGRLI